SRSLHALHSGTEVLYRLAQHCEAASLSALLTSEAHWDRPLGWRVFWCQKGKVPLRASVREKGQGNSHFITTLESNQSFKFKGRVN
uniref:Uncharacterized protein n=1 Tax=Cyprinus carpio TaxID=7962 RepID=A0A8C1Z6G2_CYPCA